MSFLSYHQAIRAISIEIFSLPNLDCLRSVKAYFWSFLTHVNVLVIKNLRYEQNPKLELNAQSLDHWPHCETP